MKNLIRKLLTKTIEIYDGTYSEHYICPLGFVLLIPTMIYPFVFMILCGLDYLSFNTVLIGLGVAVILYFIFQLMGFEKRN